MKRKLVVGVMGPGEMATAADMARAELLGALIAQRGWITLTGGRRSGVMEAALKGAKKAGGQTIAILPGKSKSEACEEADFVIATGVGGARNVINILSSDVVIASGLEAGTTSEVAHAIKEKKNVVLLTDNEAGKAFFQQLAPDLVVIANTPEDAISIVERISARHV